MSLTNDMIDEYSAQNVKMRLAIMALIEWESYGNHVDEEILQQLKDSIK